MNFSKFNTQEEIDEYLSGEKIQCLECGKFFKSLGSHIIRIHGMTANDYRDKYGLPRSTPLAGQSTRKILSNQMNTMISEGVITHDHLADAAKKIDYSNRAEKKSVSAANQKAAASSARSGKNKLETGAKSKSGRNMDQAREYQRAYRALKKRGDETLIVEYRKKYGASI